MKYSGIGGQAVMEGVMMRNGRKYAVAVRKPDHQIEVKKEDNKASLFDEKWNKVPMVRGSPVFYRFPGAGNVHPDVLRFFF